MNRRRHTPSSLDPLQPSPLQSHFIPDEPSFDSGGVLSPGVGDSDILSTASSRNLLFEYYDECVFNDLPQYLVQISDMRLYSRGELWKIFRPMVDKITIDQKARQAIDSDGEAQLRKHYKDCIKWHLKYAIFSHRWGEEEPEFTDMPSKAYPQQVPPEGSGYEKLVRCCEKAKEYGCEYVWSDTCCINKESSSELEEAIRSMYRWYRDAFVCIVYLAKTSSVEDFAQEPWFMRGWTLQELLAPERLRMFGKDWKPVCPRKEDVYPRGDETFPPNDKLSEFMLREISKVTHIPRKTIRNFDSRSPHHMVSTKMRWASKRKTTRVEDIAYSLLGIFDIMMPIAYGEGERAFQRLLEVIAQRSGDPTFFAWAGACSRYSMALPASPASYQSTVHPPYGEHDYAIQKRGIQLKLLVIRVDVDRSDPRHYMLRPRAPNLTPNLTIHGRFARTSSSYAELDSTKHMYVIGVVDFKFDHSVGPESHEEGRLLPDKKHFCIFMRITRGRESSGVELSCRRIDTQGVLPLIECKSEFRAPLRTALLEHTRFLFI